MNIISRILMTAIVVFSAGIAAPAATAATPTGTAADPITTDPDDPPPPPPDVGGPTVPIRSVAKHAHERPALGRVAPERFTSRPQRPITRFMSDAEKNAGSSRR